MLASFLKQSRLLRSSQGLVQATPSLYRQLAEAARQEEDPAETSAEVIAEPAEADPNTIVAVPREASGSTASYRLRQSGKTPAILFSLPGNVSQLLAIDSREIGRAVKRHGRQPFHCHVFNLEVHGADGQVPQLYRVVPRLVHMNAVTGAVENVTFMHMPPERRAVFDVPIQIIGEDMSPGVKRGGWVNSVQRTVSVSCPGDAILPHIEVDVSGMDLNAKLSLGTLAKMLPDGAKLIAKDLKHPVVKIGGRGNR